MWNRIGGLHKVTRGESQREKEKTQRNRGWESRDMKKKNRNKVRMEVEKKVFFDSCLSYLVRL